MGITCATTDNNGGMNRDDDSKHGITNAPMESHKRLSVQPSVSFHMLLSSKVNLFTFIYRFFP